MYVLQRHMCLQTDIPQRVKPWRLLEDDRKCPPQPSILWVSVSSDSVDVTVEPWALGRTLGTKRRFGHVPVLEEVMGSWGRQTCQPTHHATCKEPGWSSLQWVPLHEYLLYTTLLI